MNYYNLYLAKLAKRINLIFFNIFYNNTISKYFMTPGLYSKVKKVDYTKNNKKHDYSMYIIAYLFYVFLNCSFYYLLLNSLFIFFATLFSKHKKQLHTSFIYILSFFALSNLSKEFFLRENNFLKKSIKAYLLFAIFSYWKFVVVALQIGFVYYCSNLDSSIKIKTRLAEFKQLVIKLSQLIPSFKKDILFNVVKNNYLFLRMTFKIIYTLFLLKLSIWINIPFLILLTVSLLVEKFFQLAFKLIKRKEHKINYSRIKKLIGYIEDTYRSDLISEEEKSRIISYLSEMSDSWTLFYGKSVIIQRKQSKDTTPLFVKINGEFRNIISVYVNKLVPRKLFLHFSEKELIFSFYPKKKTSKKNVKKLTNATQRGSFKSFSSLETFIVDVGLKTTKKNKGMLSLGSTLTFEDHKGYSLGSDNFINLCKISNKEHSPRTILVDIGNPRCNSRLQLYNGFNNNAQKKLDFDDNQDFSVKEFRVKDYFINLIAELKSFQIINDSPFLDLKCENVTYEVTTGKVSLIDLPDINGNMISYTEEVSCINAESEYFRDTEKKPKLFLIAYNNLFMFQDTFALLNLIKDKYFNETQNKLDNGSSVFEINDLITTSNAAEKMLNLMVKEYLVLEEDLIEISGEKINFKDQKIINLLENFNSKWSVDQISNEVFSEKNITPKKSNN